VNRAVNRLEYRRKGITEWFANSKDGVEHGFTILYWPGQRGRGTQHPTAPARVELVAEQDPGAVGFVPNWRRGCLALSDREAVGDRCWWRPKVAGTLVAPGEVASDPGGRPKCRCIRIVVDPITQQAYLKASNTGGMYLFGNSVAISGDTVVVGARGGQQRHRGERRPEEQQCSRFWRGVRVCAQFRDMEPAGVPEGVEYGGDDVFGLSVAISGDTVVVGAFAEDSNATGVNGDQSNNSAPASGAAYVFVRSSGTWSQQAYLKASNTGGMTTSAYRWRSPGTRWWWGRMRRTATPPG
jgi:hypothetical protein